MLTLDRIIDNPFLALKTFGREKVQAYLLYHLVAMITMLPLMPELSPLITLTQDIYDDMFINVNDKYSKVKKRIAKTSEVDVAIKEFKVAARTTFARVVDKLHVGSPIYNELFNDGMKTYNKMIKENAETVMTFLKDGVTTYVAEIGVDIKTLVDNAYAKYQAARTAQTGFKTQIRSNNPLYDDNLDLMIVQLYVNLHTICSKNSKNPSVAKGFFEQSLLETPSHHKGKNNNGPWVIAIPVDSQMDTGLSYALGQVITLEVLTDNPVDFMGAITAIELLQPSSRSIGGKSKVKTTSEEIGCPQNKFLIVGNKNLKLIALVRITIE